MVKVFHQLKQGLTLTQKIENWKSFPERTIGFRYT